MTVEVETLLVGAREAKKATIPFPKRSDKVRITARQERALTALAAGKSNAAAAAAANVDVRTVHRWRTEEPAFSEALRRTRDDAFAEALASLRRVAAAAVSTCEALMRSTQKPEVRLAASRVVLSVVMRANEAVIVEERLRTLEERIQ